MIRIVIDKIYWVMENLLEVVISKYMGVTVVSDDDFGDGSSKVVERFIVEVDRELMKPWEVNLCMRLLMGSRGLFNEYLKLLGRFYWYSGVRDDNGESFVRGISLSYLSNLTGASQEDLREVIGEMVMKIRKDYGDPDFVDLWEELGGERSVSWCVAKVMNEHKDLKYVRAFLSVLDEFGVEDGSQMSLKDFETYQGIAWEKIPRPKFSSKQVRYILLGEAVGMVQDSFRNSEELMLESVSSFEFLQLYLSYLLEKNMITSDCKLWVEYHHEAYSHAVKQAELIHQANEKQDDKGD